jgi:RimJ/RimL family protein N-acetyltransferase
MSTALLTASHDCSTTRMRARFGGIELLEFASVDAQDLFDVRNHESVREFMPNPAPLDYDAHIHWLEQNVTPGGALRIFIVRMNQAAIGFTMVKRLPDGALELGIIFRQADQHTGLPAQTAAVMLHLLFEQLNASAVVTYVNAKHVRALAFNRGFGLVDAPSSKPMELCFRTPRAAVLGNENYRKIMARVGRSLSIEQLAWP